MTWEQFWWGVLTNSVGDICAALLLALLVFWFRDALIGRLSPLTLRVANAGAMRAHDALVMAGPDVPATRIELELTASRDAFEIRWFELELSAWRPDQEVRKTLALTEFEVVFPPGESPVYRGEGTLRMRIEYRTPRWLWPHRKYRVVANVMALEPWSGRLRLRTHTQTGASRETTVRLRAVVAAQGDALAKK